MLRIPPTIEILTFEGLLGSMKKFAQISVCIPGARESPCEFLPRTCRCAFRPDFRNPASVAIRNQLAARYIDVE